MKAMNTTSTINGTISSMEVCNGKQRRNDVRNPGEGSPNLSGLDYVEVSPDELTLTVSFLGKAPAGKIGIENILIEGGRRIRGIKVTKVKVNREKDPELDDTMDVTVDKSGDYSTYTLSLVQPKYDAQGNPTYDLFPNIDQRYGAVDFSFKAGCASDLDCEVGQVCPPTPVTEPEINYLAKDYVSFRQLLLDRLAITMPGWQEQHIPDIGIVIVEILAYVADYLSYYQDAVATESYLGTARQRISVRRHVRLMDYHIHEGCNARTWVFVSVSSDLPMPGTPAIAPGDVYFIAGADSADTSQLPPGSYEFFEPLVEDAIQSLDFYAAHDEINFYTWGDSECCLPQGATSATLDYQNFIDDKAGPTQQNLKVGDFLLFEEVLGAKTGVAADADPTHRHVVRLTSVQATTDALYNKNVVEIAWAAADALPFALCISASSPAPDCLLIENISVARGNILLVDHGQTIYESLPDCVPIATTTAYCDECERQAADITVSAGPYNPSLQQTPLTFSQPLPAAQGAHPLRTLSGGQVMRGNNRAPTAAHNAQTPAAQLLQQDPRSALPNIVLKSQPPSPDTDLLATSDCPKPIDCTTDFTNPQLSTWLPLYELLESGGEDYNFVVEMDNDGDAHLRFGDDELGREPDPLEVFCARYRVGNGPSGNVGAGTIKQMVIRNTTLNDPGLKVCNPFAATGGTLREPLREIKLYAPGAFMLDQERAITADDYARLAGGFPGVQRAAASLRWTGVNYDARVAIDPLGTDAAQPALLRSIERYLQPFRRIGHDVQVVQAEYVPIELVMNICVLPNYLAAHVKAALLAAFSNSIQSNGTRGFFHPDNLSFGGSIAVSTLVATAQTVTGVQSVVVHTLERYGDVSRMALRLGVLLIGPMEIAQLDNDPNEPEHGTLTFNMRGGR